MALASQGGVTFTVSKSPNWDKTVERYKTYSPRFRIHALLDNTANEAQQEAWKQLDAAVYNTPTPPGSVRTGKARRAVKKLRPTFRISDHAEQSGIYIDRNVANRDGFYYPRTLEEGSEKINYRARHYWQNTRIIMFARLMARGRQTLQELGADIGIAR